jgi:hypothetical protein
VFAGPKEKLDSTAVSQPAIYVASLAAVEKLRASEGGQVGQPAPTGGLLLLLPRHLTGIVAGTTH